MRRDRRARPAGRRTRPREGAAGCRGRPAARTAGAVRPARRRSGWRRRSGRLASLRQALGGLEPAAAGGAGREGPAAAAGGPTRQRPPEPRARDHAAEGRGRAADPRARRCPGARRAAGAGRARRRPSSSARSWARAATMDNVEISIGGRRFRLQCGPGEGQRVQQLARLVDQCAASLIQGQGGMGEEKVLLLSSLMVADRLEEAEHELERLRGGCSAGAVRDPGPRGAGGGHGGTAAGCRRRRDRARRIARSGGADAHVGCPARPRSAAACRRRAGGPEPCSPACAAFQAAQSGHQEPSCCAAPASQASGSAGSSSLVQ